MFSLKPSRAGGRPALLKELARKSVSHKALTAWGQGLDQTAQRPFQIFVGIAENVAAIAESKLAFQLKLKDQLMEHRQTVVTLLPELNTALGPIEKIELGPEDFGQLRNVEALTQFLDGLGERGRPALVILDDCQWADAFALKLLQRWQEKHNDSETGCHVLVVAAFRSEEVPADHPVRSIPFLKHLALPTLRRNEVGELIESMAGPLPIEVSEVVTLLSGGSPFMVSAVLRGLVESGAVVGSSNGWQVEPLRMQSLRSSSHAAEFLVRRLELLPPSTLSLLSAGAILGKEFDIEFASLLTDQSAEEGKSAALEARARHILWSDDQVLKGTFVHDKLRESLLARLDPRQRQTLHRLAAEHYEAAGTGAIFEIAYHFDAAGENARASLCDGCRGTGESPTFFGNSGTAISNLLEGSCRT